MAVRTRIAMHYELPPGPIEPFIHRITHVIHTRVFQSNLFIATKHSMLSPTICPDV